jgi:molecular chaperone GrpE
MTKHEKHNKQEENTEQKLPEVPPIENNDGLKEELEKTKDLLLRKAAEFENYKRRTENDLSNYIKYASESVIKKLLPVLDDFKRASESVNKGETNDFETLREGFNLIFEKFNSVLESEGLKEIDIEGKPFDVDLCDALLQVTRSDVPPHTVTKVVEQGYFLKDKVLRHAKVLVSAEPEGNTQINNSEE